MSFIIIIIIIIIISVEPWMTPDVTSTGTDNASPTRTRNARQVRKLESYSSALPQIPKEVAASIT